MLARRRRRQLRRWQQRIRGATFRTHYHRRSPVPILHHLQLDERRIRAQRPATHLNRLRLTFRPDNRGVRLDLRFELRELRFRRLLFLHHLQLDRLLQLR